MWIKICIGLHLIARYSFQILIQLEFSKHIIAKIRPVQAEVFHADGLTEGQTDWGKDGQTWRSWHLKSCWLANLCVLTRKFYKSSVTDGLTTNQTTENGGVWIRNCLFLPANKISDSTVNIARPTAGADVATDRKSFMPCGNTPQPSSFSYSLATSYENLRWLGNKIAYHSRGLEQLSSQACICHPLA
jgi:hypothetical protein